MSVSVGANRNSKGVLPGYLHSRLVDFPDVRRLLASFVVVPLESCLIWSASCSCPTVSKSIYQPSTLDRVTTSHNNAFHCVFSPSQLLLRLSSSSLYPRA